jgi:hypothetical protein
MPGWFHLTPKDPKHDSWRFSLTRKDVFIIANDENQARNVVADSLEDFAEPLPPARRYEKIMRRPSPWLFPDVTSCEEDADFTGPGNFVISSDGEKWPAKY